MLCQITLKISLLKLVMNPSIEIAPRALWISGLLSPNVMMNAHNHTFRHFIWIITDISCIYNGTSTKKGERINEVLITFTRKRDGENSQYRQPLICFYSKSQTKLCNSNNTSWLNVTRKIIVFIYSWCFTHTYGRVGHISRIYCYCTLPAFLLCEDLLSWAWWREHFYFRQSFPHACK